MVKIWERKSTAQVNRTEDKSNEIDSKWKFWKRHERS
jgi:hypothetical protein